MAGRGGNGFPEVDRPHARCATLLLSVVPWVERLPVLSLADPKTKEAKPRSHQGAASAAGREHSPSFSSLCRRRDMPYAGALLSRDAGREAWQEPSGSQPARGAQTGGAPAHSLATAPGSARRRGSRVGSLGRESRRLEVQQAAGTQPPLRAPSASRLLPSPAFHCKSFRDHAESSAFSGSQSPRAASHAWRGGLAGMQSAVPASTSEPL